MNYRNLIAGANIFAKYEEGGLDEHLGGADHDVIFFAHQDLEISEEDLAVLDELGFHISDEYDCWICYV